MYGLVILMIHRDRPSIRLTAGERRQFDELAHRLRYELDGATFDPPRRRWARRRLGPDGRPKRAIRVVTALVGAWWAGPASLALGLLALGPIVAGWVAVANPAVIVPPAALTGLGAALVAVDLVRRARRWSRRLRIPSVGRARSGKSAADRTNHSDQR